MGSMGSREAQRRIISTVQRVESAPRSYTPPVRAPRLSGISGNTCLTTSSITARSGTTPGSGTVTIQDNSTGVFVAGATLTVLNFTATAIATGKYCYVVDGWVISSEC